MSEPRDVTLPSGHVVRIMPSPFSEAKALYQAILKEIGGIDFKKENEIADIFKTIFARSFSSPEVEKCLWACMGHCLYNYGQGDFKINKEVFEDPATREDYTDICLEVAKENVYPFVKSLYLQFKPVLDRLLGEGSQKLNEKTPKAEKTS